MLIGEVKPEIASGLFTLAGVFIGGSVSALTYSKRLGAVFVGFGVLLAVLAIPIPYPTPCSGTSCADPIPDFSAAGWHILDDNQYAYALSNVQLSSDGHFTSKLTGTSYPTKNSCQGDGCPITYNLSGHYDSGAHVLKFDRVCNCAFPQSEWAVKLTNRDYGQGTFSTPGKVGTYNFVMFRMSPP